MDIHTATEQAYKNGYEKGRTEAIEEFAERLKNLSYQAVENNGYISQSRVVLTEDIDNLAKEMAGGTNG